MKKIPSLAVITTCALLTSFLSAQAANQNISTSGGTSSTQPMPDPSEVLTRSMEIFSKVGSIRMDMISKDASGQEIPFISDRKTSQDGIVREKTVVNIPGDKSGLNMVSLSLPEGMYQLFTEKKKALHLKFLSDVQQESAASIPTLSKASASSFTITLGTYDGKQCYIIEERISAAEQAAIKSEVEKSSALKKMNAPTDIPTIELKIYKISIPESTLLLQESYDSEGNLLSSIKYKSITETQLPDTYFAIPEDCEISEITTIDEMSKKMMEILDGE